MQTGTKIKQLSAVASGRFSWQRFSLLSVFALLAMLGNTRAQGVSYTFIANDQGWSIINLPTASPPFDAPGSFVSGTYLSTGGNPGGYLSATDPDSGDFYFQAPGLLQGDFSALYGGSLSFDLWLDNNDYQGAPGVILAGGGQVIVAPTTAPQPGAWRTVNVPLAPEGGWKLGSLSGGAASPADIQQVLANVTLLRIRGEYVVNQVGIEQGRIDNIILVPEPAGLAVTALCLFAALGRKRR